MVLYNASGLLVIMGKNTLVDKHTIAKWSFVRMNQSVGDTISTIE